MRHRRDRPSTSLGCRCQMGENKMCSFNINIYRISIPWQCFVHHVSNHLCVSCPTPHPCPQRCLIKTFVKKRKRNPKLLDDHTNPSVRYQPHGLKHKPEYQSSGDFFDLETVKHTAKCLACCRLSHDAHQRRGNATSDKQLPGPDS